MSVSGLLYKEKQYWKLEDVPIPLHLKFAFGGSAGMCATVFVQPLDLIKNRMQLSAKNEYNSSIHAFRSIFAAEGLVGIYSGLSAGLLRQATYSTTRLGVFTMLLNYFTIDGVQPPFIYKIFMGMFAGMCGAFVGTPAEVALIRMTADGRLPHAQRRNYKNVLDALVTIVRQDGAAGLWRGAAATMSRAMVVNAAQLGSYSQAKEVLLHAELGDNVGTHLVASMAAGFVTAFASMPVDICKTKIQNMRVIDGQPEYRGTLDVIMKVIKSEGPLALWKGFVPYFLRIGPHTVITFIFLEQFTRAYRTYRFSRQ